MTPSIGVIADDFTGASDIASFLVKGGLKTIQVNGIPAEPVLGAHDVEAIVVSLKTRTCPADQAVEESLEATRWLKSLGCTTFYFKYCSTFDSTAEGNIGPVLNAMLDELALPQALVCPALPANGRTVYQGHLFVYDQLLSDSPLKDHPLTPMRDANLSRLLAAQLPPEQADQIALISMQDLESGQWRDAHHQARYLICDALNEAHLHSLMQRYQQKQTVLFSGGSGLAEFMADYLNTTTNATSASAPGFNVGNGQTLMLAGSCSAATRGQIEYVQNKIPSYFLPVPDLMTENLTPEQVLDWVREQDSEAALIYSSMDPAEVRMAQSRFGTEQVSNVIEQFMARLAQLTSATNIIVAGGETSGAVVQALNHAEFRVGPSICPGVPLLQTLDEAPKTLALKSGNFGHETFFIDALNTLQESRS